MSLIVSDEKQLNNTIAYIKKSSKQVAKLDFKTESFGIAHIELNDDYHFQLIPFKHKERSTIFVAGESGAGKSFFVREYAKEYKKMYPQNPIYLISYLDEDETLDAYKEIIRLKAFDTEFLKECVNFDLKKEFNDCFVIYDDIDSIVDKKVKIPIYGLLNKMLRLGRHCGTSVAYAGHELYASPELKSILNESMTITFFPQFLNYKKLKYLLEVYFGLSKDQIARIMAIKDRNVTYIKGSNKVILSNEQAFIL